MRIRSALMNSVITIAIAEWVIRARILLAMSAPLSDLVFGRAAQDEEVPKGIGHVGRVELAFYTDDQSPS